MNILEHYIKEIHNEKPCTDKWTEKHEEDFVIVDVTVNCYGAIEEKTNIFEKKQWEAIKKQGYYMA